jgi:hypothetical protein
MAGVFQLQGFGVLSEWNGQVASGTADVAMQEIAATGANSIEITPRIWTASQTSSTVFADPTKTESDASLIAGIENAEKAGLSVILRPAISPLDGTGSAALAPSDVAAFFASYKAEIVHLAQIAQQTGVATFALGNEMSSLTGAQYLPYWQDIIASVRAVYHGALTYSAATDEASKVSFWNELDTIGVNTYPPLSVPGTPTVQDIVNAWHQVPTNPYWAAAFEQQSPVDFLHSLSVQYGKPVLMTEAGYLSIDYGGMITGSWKLSGSLNVQEQADAYAAFFQVWASQSTWMKGVEFWQWDLSNAYSPNGFSPMGKPAQAIVSEYFSGVGSLAANVAALTASDIASIAALGIKTIAVTDTQVTLNAAQRAAFGAHGIALTEPYGPGSQTWTWNADGSVHDVRYYSINGTTATTFDVVYAGGSVHDVHYSGITGQPYTDFDVVYGANGKPATASYSNGMTETWSYNPDGSLHEVVYAGITGQRWTSSDTLYGGNGKPLFEVWRNGTTVAQTETWNPDGSIHDVHIYGITGQPYTDEDILYGANGKPASATFSNGMVETWSYNPDGSLAEIVYAGVTNASYTSLTTSYDASGHAVVQQSTNAAGALTISGLADHLTLVAPVAGAGAAGAAGAAAVGAAAGSSALAAQPDVTLTGGGSDETFVFGAGFGHASITDFVPQTLANTNHDTIVFAPGLFAGVDDVLSHATQSGRDTVLAAPSGDTLVLEHVTASQLTAKDFAIR